MRRSRVTLSWLSALVVGAGSVALPVTAGCIDGDGDGFCRGVDCNDLLAACTTDCTDADVDGVCLPDDCDDTLFGCIADCTEADGDGICDDRDNCPDDPNGGQPFVRKLNGPLQGIERIDYQDEDGIRLSADGRHVAFRVAFDERLQVAHVSGNGVPVTLLSADTVFEFSFTPDGSRIVCKELVHSPLSEILWSVPVDGGSPTRLNRPGQPFGGDFFITQDSSTVIFRGGAAANEYSAMFSVPVSGGVGGGGPIQLTPVDDDVRSFRISPDGARIVYTIWTPGSNFHLYSISSGGGAAVQLSGDDVSDYRISPDSTTVVYETGNVTQRLHRVPIGGGAIVPISDPYSSIGGTRFSPDSTHVVFRARPSGESFGHLYSVPVAGGADVVLGPPEANNVGPFAITADSTMVVFWRSTVGGLQSLYSNAIGGGSSVHLRHGAIGPHFEVSPDGATVLYTWAYASGGPAVLVAEPLGGGAHVEINAPLGVDAGVSDFAVNGDWTQVAYSADAIEDGRYDLYSVPFGSPGAAALVDVAAIVDGEVVRMAFTPDGNTIVYAGDLEILHREELYRASPTRPGGADADNDDRGAACDCDDSNPTCALECTDGDGDGYCVAEDCDDTHPFCTVDCSDSDGDGYCAPADCDDSLPNCVTDCTDPDGDGFCADTDCDSSNPNCTTDCTDGDGDGFCVTADCNESDSDSWGIPGPASDLRFFSESVMSWLAPSEAGSPINTLLWDTLRSSDGGDFVTGMTCVEEGELASVTTIDAEEPESGEVFYYLPRPSNGCGPGSAGTDGDGLPRPTGPC